MKNSGLVGLAVCHRLRYCPLFHTLIYGCSVCVKEFVDFKSNHTELQ